MSLKTSLFILLTAFFTNAIASNFEGELELQKVTNNIYAIVGSTGGRTAKNFGNNATSGFVITSKGIVLIDSGATLQGAKNIHKVIQSVTNKPIVYVINSGGQDHRWLGNSYFKQLGATIIASADAVKDQKARVKEQFFMLENQVGLDGVKGTTPVYADKQFNNKLNLTVGDTQFELLHTSAAHTPGDSVVWLPKQKTVFTGDIVFSQRILGVLDHSSSKGWIQAFEDMAALKPQHVVPGHGHATDLATARKDTLDYLKFLRNAVADFMDNDGDIADISTIDQSAFSYLKNFKLLAGRNAQNVYSELEWE